MYLNFYAVVSKDILILFSNSCICVCSFREVLGPHQEEKFMEEMGLDVVVFRGITNRTRKCRLRRLDLRGFSLSKDKPRNSTVFYQSFRMVNLE